MDTNTLRMVYQMAREKNDVDAMCNCIIRCFQIIENDLHGDASKADANIIYCMADIDVLFYGTMLALNEDDREKARFYYYSLLKFDDTTLREHLYSRYLLARVEYLQKNYKLAEEHFSTYQKFRYENWDDFDELCLFYRANCLAMLEEFEEAGKLYEKIFEIKQNFPEADKNIRVVHRRKNNNLIHKVTSLWQPFDIWKVPIFINARDRVEFMKKQIEWLLDAGYKNLIILDNDSTYPKLLEYYGELDKDNRIKIIRLGKNLGFKALWKSGVLEKMKINTPYVYTDPDVVPVENCPKDFVKHLWKILDSNHELQKVGLGLVWNDITCFDSRGLKKSISNMQTFNKVGDNILFAPVDTTFALYSNVRHYNLRFSVRTLGENNTVMLKHLPWYLDYDNLPEDEKYYMEHAESDSASLVKSFLEQQKN